jgi:hypothetical protein
MLFYEQKALIFVQISTEFAGLKAVCSWNHALFWGRSKNTKNRGFGKFRSANFEDFYALFEENIFCG